VSKEEPEEIHHPNDSFNRRWFRDSEAAAPVLKVIAPDSIKGLITPDNLKLEPTSFIDRKLRSTQSDLLWSCRSTKNKNEILAYFYILWEHQTSVDHWMVLTARKLLFQPQRPDTSHRLG
jgi:predicted transposase YdaD